MQIKLENQPIVVLVDCLRKAGSSKNLSIELGIHETTVYGWMRFNHGISEELFERLKNYRSAPLVKAAAVEPTQEKTAWNRKESGLSLPSTDVTVRIMKHGLTKDDIPYVLAKTVPADETVFVPSFVAYEIVKQAEYIKIGDTVKLRVVKDLSNRSNYVAKKFLAVTGG